MLSLRDAAGEVAGICLAPAVAAVSRARRARMFHPRGRTYLARVAADPQVPSDLERVAHRLEGRALARFSAALWRAGFEHLDVLGIALRFRDAGKVTAEPALGDQDLLFATIVSPFTMPLSPLTTDAHDFLANTYWAVSPFELREADGRRVKFRLRPARHARESDLPRDERLAAQVTASGAALHLEIRPTLALGWKPLATVHVIAPANLDEEALRFSAFRDGRGLVPRGFVQRLRHAVYPASQAARPTASL